MKSYDWWKGVDKVILAADLTVYVFLGVYLYIQTANYACNAIS